MSNTPPFGPYLQYYTRRYQDDRDQGIVLLTPLYLLLGCAMPLWLHSPSLMTTLNEENWSSTQMLPALAGVLALGIGDTFVS